MRKSACFCIVTATYYWMLIMLGIVLMALYALFHLIFITPWSKYYYHLHLQIMKLRVRKFNSPEVLWLVRGELDLTPGEISCALHHAVLHFTAQLISVQKWLSPFQMSGIVLKMSITRMKQMHFKPWLPVHLMTSHAHWRGKNKQFDFRKTHSASPGTLSVIYSSNQ